MQYSEEIIKEGEEGFNAIKSRLLRNDKSSTVEEPLIKFQE